MEKNYFDLSKDVLKYMSDLDKEKKYRELYDFVYGFTECIPCNLQLRMALEIILSLGQEVIPADKFEEILKQQVKSLKFLLDSNPTPREDPSCYEDII